MSDNDGEGEILMLQGKSGLCPFYMKQPKERMDLLFSKYENLLRKSLGDDIVAVFPMGSPAIPGMVGSPMVDILLAMKNSPPTDAQVRGICKPYQDDFCFKIGFCFNSYFANLVNSFL